MINKKFRFLVVMFAVSGVVLMGGTTFSGKAFAEDDAGSEVVLKVSGMSCGACSNKVKAALSGCEGVIKADVDHKTGKAVITVDGEKTNAETLIDVIKKSGFKAETESETES